MKIVVLDGHTLNPGDLDWIKFNNLGELTVYDKTSFDTDSIVERIGDAEIVLTNKTPINASVVEKAPNIKYIGVLATGYNIIDIDAANKSNITVTNIPAYGTKAVAQFVMGLLLEMCHHIGDHNVSVHNKDWTRSVYDCYWNSPLVELEGKTIGLIGFGNIGQATAKLAQAFGMNVLVNSRTVKPEYESSDLQFVSLDELFKKSDVISLHCPLTPTTKGIINSSNLAKMKQTAMLINTSRGGLVVEKDLAKFLNDDKIFGAAVDVVSVEPMKEDNVLLTAKNCIITPHIAWATREARARLMNTAVENLISFREGATKNVVE